MSRPYLFIRDLPGQRAELVALVEEIEQRGFPGVMSPSFGDNLALSLALLDRTERLVIGTGIANIYTRHLTEMASAASIIEELHPGRFILGIGVSHPPAHRRLGVNTGKPLGDMRRYVDGLRSAWQEVPHPPLMVAALRDRMTRLAGEVGDGIMWANAMKSHLPHSLGQLRGDVPDGFIVSNVAPAAVDEDRDTARERARQGLVGYMGLKNYINYFAEAGYAGEVEAAQQAASAGNDAGVLEAISDAMVDDSCVYGTPAEVRESFQAWLDAGVTHMALSAAGSDLVEATRALMDAFED